MKTHPKSGLAALVLALFTAGSAGANDPQWRAIDNHHGGYTYLASPAQTGPTIAFGGRARGIGSATTTVKRTNSSPKSKLGFREVTTPHDTVNYFVPAE